MKPSKKQLTPMEKFFKWADKFFFEEGNLNKPFPMAYAVELYRKWHVDNYGLNDLWNHKFFDLKEYAIRRKLRWNPFLNDPVTGVPLFYDTDCRPIIDCKLDLHFSRTSAEYFVIGDEHWGKKGSVK